MRARKTFNASDPILIGKTEHSSSREDGAILRLAENPTGSRTIDLSKLLGHRIDRWVMAVVAQLDDFIQSEIYTIPSVIAYGGGIKKFCGYLIDEHRALEPTDLNLAIMEGFVRWLTRQGNADSTSQHSFSQAKVVLVALQQRGLIGGDRTIFPRNPFPQAHRTIVGATSISSGERVRLAEALRLDLIAYFKGTLQATEAQGLAVHILALAMRTGLNPTSMLELERDCLRPHPFMPTMMVLQACKRRGSGTQLKNLRLPKQNEASTSIPMDGVAILRLVLNRTAQLLPDAPDALKNRVWLHRKRGAKTGNVSCLDYSTLETGIAAFVGRHDLRADDGSPLRLNLSRLRKTMANRVFAISDGDLIVSAAIMGHTPQVSETHYLACTDDMRRNATFVGEALADTYRGVCGESNEEVIPMHSLEPTPVGSCKDSLNGEKAPGNGSHCADFFSCFSCRSYAIVGAKKDLHRLFSFYWFLDAERQTARSREWRERFVSIMTLIDAFTLDKFDAALVQEAKGSARVQPLAFWRSYQLNSTERGTHDGGK